MVSVSFIITTYSTHWVAASDEGAWTEKPRLDIPFGVILFIAQSERNGGRNRRISESEVIELVTHTHRGVATHR